MTIRATWNGAVLAESDSTVVVEGNHYFPSADVSDEYFESSDTHSVCPWKGTASYRTVVVDGNRNEDAAWFYPAPLDVDEITGYITFADIVAVEDAPA